MNQSHQKSAVVSKSRVPDILELIAHHIKRFNGEAWRCSEPPLHGRITVESARDREHGPRLHIFDRDMEIVVSLRPGFRVQTTGTLVTPQLFREIPRTQVLKIVLRDPLR